jgi:succinoglycan biosynthesis transport protein ExoP
MLLTRTASAVSRDEGSETNSSASLLLAGLGFARRQFWLILCSLVLAACVGALYLLITLPTYTASATMLIDSRRGGVQQKSVLGDPPGDAAWIDSQIGIFMLERDKIGQAVAKKLELAKNTDIQQPEESFLGSLIAPLLKLVEDDVPAKGASAQERMQQAAGEVAGGLDVKRVGLSYLVNINYSSHNQELAAKIANAAADAYAVAELNAKYQSLQQASDWLQDRYQTLREQASAADRAVVEFKSQNNIITAGGLPIADQQLTEINNRLGAARATTADKQARLNQIEAVLRDHEATGTVDSTVTDALGNPIVTKLRGQYLDLINKEADWSKRFGNNHLAVINLRNQARDIRASTHEELKRIAESYRSDVAIAKQNEAELEKQLETLVALIPNNAQITLRGLESSAQSYRKFYDNFLLNYTDSVQQQSSPIAETRVVSYASWAYKSFPSTPRVIAMAIFGGLALGVGLGMLREMLDQSFRTAAQVKAELQSECLTLIPKLEKRVGFSLTANVHGDPKGQRLMVPGADHWRFANASPFSRFVESIRALKLAADARGPSGSAKVIGLTSAIPQEGKSTIAVALAAHIAQLGERVIIVDCDLRNPALSRSCAHQADYGIINVLSGERSLDQTVWTDPAIDLTFLPAGKVSRIRNTSQLFLTPAMTHLFDLLRARYDYIIVDLSPLAPVVDVRATTRLIDFYVLLVEWGQTKISVVQHALKEAPGVYDNLLGVVLNKVDMNTIARYESYYSQAYRNKYFNST